MRKELKINSDPNRSRTTSQASDQSEKKETRGGKRENAGRKSIGGAVKKRANFRLAPDIIEYLDSQSRPKIEIVEEALRMHKRNNNNI